MNAQTLTTPATIFNFFVVLPDEDFATEQPICVSSRDYGFDLDEEEVAEELLAPLPASLRVQTQTKVDPGEFETRYSWFQS